MAGAAAVGPWLRRFQPAPHAKVRLACFPHAGAAASSYYPTAVALSPLIDVLAVQYPGRQDRSAEPLAAGVEEIADHVAYELLAWADRPLALFGHSMGALVAFEVARRLEGLGVELAALFASGSPAPSAPRPTWPTSDADLIADMVLLGGTSREVLDDAELLAISLPVLRGDYVALGNYAYRPGEPLRCPVTVLAGNADPRVGRLASQDWKRHTAAGFRARVFPAGHFFLEAHAREVRALILEQLAPHR